LVVKGLMPSPIVKGLTPGCDGLQDPSVGLGRV